MHADLRRQRGKDGGVANNQAFERCANACRIGSIIESPTNELFNCLIVGERAESGMGADCYVECLAGE